MDATKSRESSLFLGVNAPADPNHLSDLEKKHLPVIESIDEVDHDQWLEVSVEVGRLLEHPNEHQHFIQFIDLYADDTFLCRADFTSAKVRPQVTFCVKLLDEPQELRAYAHCNMHGTWKGVKPVQVR